MSDGIPLPSALLLGLVAAQRIAEIAVSRRNLRGASLPAAGSAWDWASMVAMHVLLIVLPAAEALALGARAPVKLACAAGVCFLAAQALRYWAIASLGPAWNARAVVDPRRGVVARGPYRWIRHPNYLAVMVEFSAVPLFCGAWRSWIVLNALHAPVLARRIRAEEALLATVPGYTLAMAGKGRFLPRRWRLA